jgi:hypothetical protein
MPCSRGGRNPVNLLPVQHPRAGIAVVATLAIMTAACSSPPSSANPTNDTPPFPIGQIGTPVHAKATGGATAHITLNSAAWFPRAAPAAGPATLSN